MDPWLELCRAAVADVEAVLVAMPSRDERERPVGEGKGGDITAALDAAAEAVAAVDQGAGSTAFLVRAPTVAQVAEFAARGETMPQKSTFFYPKLTSGLFLFPV